MILSVFAAMLHTPVIWTIGLRKLGNRYPPVGALAYRRGKARASDLPPQLQCNDKVAKNIFWTGAGGPHLIGNFGEVR